MLLMLFFKGAGSSRACPKCTLANIQPESFSVRRLRLYSKYIFAGKDAEFEMVSTARMTKNSFHGRQRHFD
jgi:hypothetical protein